MLFRIKPNKVISVFLLTVLIIQVNSVAWIQFWFYFNQETLAKTVCEQVVVKCEGGCYLSKQIEKETAPTPVAPKAGRSDFKIKDKTDPAVLFFSLSRQRADENSIHFPTYILEELTRIATPPDQPPRLSA